MGAVTKLWAWPQAAGVATCDGRGHIRVGVATAQRAGFSNQVGVAWWQGGRGLQCDGRGLSLRWAWPPPFPALMAAETAGAADAGRAPRLPPRWLQAPPLLTVEMHTGGEPLRVIPRLEAAEAAVASSGLSLLALRRHVAATQDHVRRALVHEPRGHRGMYGALVVRGEAAVGDADLAALFLHGAGYSAMCGHAVLALGRFALDYGLVAAPRCPETPVRLRCPCGVVTAFVPWDGRRSGNPVRFHSVPAFAAATGGA